MAEEEKKATQEDLMEKYKGCLAELLNVLLKHNMLMGDKDWLINQFDMSIMENYRKAVAKQFQRKHQNFITMQQVDDVLKSDTPFLED